MEKTDQKVVFENPKPGEYTIVHRHGEAEPIKVLNPALIGESAIITGPLVFYTVRKGMEVPTADGGKRPYFPKEFTHVKVNREGGTIALIWGETKEEQQRISGSLEFAEQYKKLNLNNAQATCSPKDLANNLKRFRFLFTDQSEAMKIIADLLTFRADIKTNLVAEQDTRGGKKNMVQTSVESNMPLQFTMKLEIYKGFPRQAVKVDICFNATTNNVECWLESIDALEWVEKQKVELFDEQLQPFKDDEIAVIES